MMQHPYRALDERPKVRPEIKSVARVEVKPDLTSAKQLLPLVRGLKSVKSFNESPESKQLTPINVAKADDHCSEKSSNSGRGKPVRRRLRKPDRIQTEDKFMFRVDREVLRQNHFSDMHRVPKLGPLSPTSDGFRNGRESSLYGSRIKNTLMQAEALYVPGQTKTPINDSKKMAEKLPTISKLLDRARPSIDDHPASSTILDHRRRL